MSEADAAKPVGQRGRNEDIQALRGVAALLVLLYHASFYLQLERNDSRMLAVFGGEFGLVGVAIFFAISGALMAKILPRTPPADFLLHRVARIYPSFLIATLVLPPLLISEFWTELGPDWSDWPSTAVAMVAGTTLVPIGTNGAYFLRIEWTLLFELFYYVTLTLLALAGLRRQVGALAGLMLLATLVGLVVLTDESLNTLTPTLLLIALLPANAAFAAGMLAPRLAGRGLFGAGFALVALLATLVLLRFGLPVGRILSGVVALLPVGLALASARRGQAIGLVSRLASRLGDMSYALYLVHVPVVLFVYRTVDAPPLVAWGLAIVAAIAVSIPFGQLDIRLYAVLKRWIDQWPTGWKNAMAGLYLAAYGATAAVFLIRG